MDFSDASAMWDCIKAHSMIISKFLNPAFCIPVLTFVYLEQFPFFSHFRITSRPKGVFATSRHAAMIVAVGRYSSGLHGCKAQSMFLLTWMTNLQLWITITLHIYQVSNTSLELLCVHVSLSISIPLFVCSSFCLFLPRNPSKYYKLLSMGNGFITWQIYSVTLLCVCLIRHPDLIARQSKYQNSFLTMYLERHRGG